jgi:hypothetical protein
MIILPRKFRNQSVILILENDDGAVKFKKFEKLGVM